MLVYGKAGVGKTRLLATAPAPVIFSAEGGLLSLRSMRLPYIEVKTMAQLNEGYQWLINSHEARQFATPCLDSISEIVEVLLTHEMGRTKDPRKAYGEIITQGLKLIRDFRDIPGRNVVLVAKEEYSKDDSTGTMYFGPAFPGQKLGPAVPYYPDEIFQYNVFQNPQTGQRVEALRCWPDRQNIAKDRSGSLAEWEQPNLTAIFNKIMQGPRA